MRVAAVCLVSALAMVAGCQKKATRPQAPNQAPPAAGADASASGPTILSAPDRPHRKPGLWDMQIASAGGPGMTLSAQVCLDEKSDRDTPFTAQSHVKNCTESFNRAPGGYAFHSNCKVSGRSVVSDGRITGDFNTNYAIDIDTRMDPPIGGGMGNVHTSIKSQWIGPCAPGQTPGKITMNVRGMTFHADMHGTPPSAPN